MKTPLISVLIPTYNRAHTIVRALRSVLTSSYSNFEIIISDNASQDETVNLARAVLSRSRFHHKIIEGNENKGPVANWIRAFNYSSGQLIKFVWSDDAVTASTLGRLAAPLLVDNAVAFSFCPAVIERTPNKKSSRQHTYRCGHGNFFDLDKFAVGFGARIPHLPVSPGAALMRREAVALGIRQLDSLPSTCVQRAIGPDLVLLYAGLLEKGMVGISCEDTEVIFYEDATSITKNTDRRQLNDCYDKATLALLEDFPDQRNLFLHLRLLRACIDRRPARSAISAELRSTALEALRPRPLIRTVTQLLMLPFKRQAPRVDSHTRHPK